MRPKAGMARKSTNVAARKTSANMPARESATNGMSAAEAAMAPAASMPAAALGAHRHHRNCEERREGNQATHKDIIRPFFPPEIAETPQ